MRCFGEGTALYERYHDLEWGRPLTGEQALYERICLEGFQAGLAWITVLRKREALRQAFAGFDPEVVVGLDVEPLIADARLIRSRAKLSACVTNAAATLDLRRDGGLPALLWSAAQIPSPRYEQWSQVPAHTPISAALARDLRRRGFVFVGPTTTYALLQACGLVGDHLAGCPVRPEVEALRAAVPSPAGRAARALGLEEAEHQEQDEGQRQGEQQAGPGESGEHGGLRTILDAIESSPQSQKARGTV